VGSDGIGAVLRVANAEPQDAAQSVMPQYQALGDAAIETRVAPGKEGKAG
jgi:hypothetical protein